MIKNIVFDIGNVLVHYRPMEYLEKRYAREDAEFLLAAIFESAEWMELDRGTVTEDEALKRFIARAPGKEALLREVMSDLSTIFTPIESSIATLKELRKAGYTMLYLSNISHDIFAYIARAYDFLEEFEGGIASAKVQTLKPGEDIYHHLITQYAIKPEETVFIDDTDHNIRAAKTLDFKTIHLTNPDDLKYSLKELGVNLGVWE